jgi:TolA-binding protein
MRLDDHVAALRDLGHDETTGSGSETRLRVRRSLERGHGMRRHAGLLAALAVLLVASASWALATGKIQRLWRSEPVVTPAPVTVAGHAPDGARPRVVAPPPIVAEPAPAVPAPAPAIVSAPEPTHAPAPPIVHRAREMPNVETPNVVAPARVEAGASGTAEPIAPVTPTKRSRYQRAYDLYFHGTDYAAALAALDDYLAAEPDGQFVVEARYNRALCLVRLDRLVEARAALAPFAHGDVVPAGYRAHEAQTLIDKIDRRAQKALNGSK